MKVSIIVSFVIVILNNGIAQDFKYKNDNSLDEIGIVNEISINKKFGRTANIQKLDSVSRMLYDKGVLSYSQKYIYDYNENGRLDTEFIYSGSWKTGKVEYEYYESGKIFRHSPSDWSADDSTWNTFNRDEYFYDKSDNLTTKINYYSYRDENEIYKNFDSKSNYFYDENNNKVSQENLSWNSSYSQWDTCGISSFKYDNLGNLVERIFAISYQGHCYEGTESSLPEFTKYIYSYDNLNQLQFIISSEKVFGVTNWVLKRKIEYNTLLELKSSISYFDYNVQADTFRISKSDTITYDKQGNVISFIKSIFDININSLKYYSKAEQVYDTNILISEMLFPSISQVSYDITNYINKPLTKKYYLFSDKKWNKELQKTFYYSEKTVNVNSNTNSDVVVYPNPTSTSINFKMAGNQSTFQIALYNTNGQKVKENIIKKGESLPILNLERGLYLYRITLSNRIITGKLFLE